MVLASVEAEPEDTRATAVTEMGGDEDVTTIAVVDVVVATALGGGTESQ